MVELARHHGAGPISLAEMADHENLPRPYLEQLVVSLREAGLVHTTRGAHGGYELSREPEEIRMGEVLRALEGPIAPMVCASEDPAHAGDLRPHGLLHGESPVADSPARDQRCARLDHARRPRDATAEPSLPLDACIDHSTGEQRRSYDRHPYSTRLLDDRDRRTTGRSSSATCTSSRSRIGAARSCAASTSRSDRAKCTRSWAATAGQDDARLCADGPPVVRGDAAARSSGRAATSSS